MITGGPEDKAVLSSSVDSEGATSAIKINDNTVVLLKLCSARMCYDNGYCDLALDRGDSLVYLPSSFCPAIGKPVDFPLEKAKCLDGGTSFLPIQPAS